MVNATIVVELATEAADTRPDRTLRTDALLAVLTTACLLVTAWAIVRDLTRQATAAWDAPPIATVGTVVKSAKRRPHASLVWDAVATGDDVWQGDGIFVPKGSAADVRFAGGTVLSLTESSLVVVETPAHKYESAERLAISVRSGSVTGTAGAAGVTLKVGDSAAEMPAGAWATVGEAADGKTRVTVHEGSAVVRDSAGTRVAVGATQRTMIDGGIAGAAVDLSVWLLEPPPGHRAYFAGESTSMTFSWGGKPGRRLLEISDDRSFYRTIRRLKVRGNRTTIDGLPAGTFFWRVRSVRGGDVTDQRSLALIRDTPPAPVRPARGQVLYLPGSQSSTFTWTPVAGVTRYRVQVASDTSFTTVDLEREIDGSSMRFRGTLPEGVYHWRVRSVAEERGESPYSPAVPFRLVVEPLPRAPRLYDPEIELFDHDQETPSTKTRRRRPRKSGAIATAWPLVRLVLAAAAKPAASILLRWEAIPGIKRYVVQIAEDETFERIVVDEEVSQPFYRWNVVSTRQYWWRVQSIDARGRKGRFGSPRKVGVVLGPPELLSPPSGASFLIGSRLPPIELTWKRSRLAVRHEVVVSMDERFSTSLATFRIHEATITWQPPRAGRYYWRARSADATGALTGYSRTRHLVVKLAAPQPVRPAAHTVVAPGATAIPLEVRPIATATQYEFEVAEPGSFATPIQTARGKRPRLTVAPRAAGALAWRARAVTGSGPSPWSTPVPFVIGLATPAVVQPQPDARLGFRAADSETAIAWKPVPGAQAYEVIIASESLPAEVIVRRQVAETTAIVRGLTAGTYGVRVLALGRGGVTSRTDAPSTRFARVQLPPLPVPKPEAPAARAHVSFRGDRPPLRLSWSGIAGAHAYDIELAPLDHLDAEPAGDAWQRMRSEQTRVERLDLASGFYAWRVRAVDTEGVPGAFSAAIHFYFGEPLPARADVELSPDPVVGGTPVTIDVRVVDETGEPTPGVPLVARVARGAVDALMDAGPGLYTTTYRPPTDLGTDDELTITGPGGFSSSHTIALSRRLAPFSVGAAVGLVTNFGAITSPTLLVEGGYRLGVMQGRLLAVVRAGYHYADLDTEASQNVTASQHAIPIAAGVRLELPRVVVVPYIAASALAAILHARLSVEAELAQTVTTVGLGAEAVGGVALGLGPGALFAEIRYGWSRAADDTFKLDAGGLTLVVGYRIEP